MAQVQVSPDPRVEREPKSALAGGLLMGCLVLAGFNLRPALASVGALLDQIRDGLGMSSAIAGVLTAVPSAAFALAGVLTGRMLRRTDPARVIAFAMALLGVGLATRVVAFGSALFLACSAVAVVGIGIGNVTMPALVRRYFPHRVAFCTGLYSTALTAGAALSAGTSVPISHALGSWRGGLAVWVVPAVLGVLGWVLVRDRVAPPGVPPAKNAAVGSGARRARPWDLAVFFGMQAAGAYIVLGWMPQILEDAGVSSRAAGAVLALTTVVTVPFAFLVPQLIGRGVRPAQLIVLLCGLGAAGYLGLLFAPASAPWLWAILLGISQATFPLALTLIGMQGRTSADVTRLSAFTQGAGYLVSTPGPLLVGLLNDWTSGWTGPLVFMLALLVPQLVCGVRAARRATAGT